MCKVVNEQQQKLTFYNDANEVADELFGWIRSRYPGNLETSMSQSNFYFWLNWNDQTVYYKCHKVNLWRGGSYIDSPDWIKKQKATMNPQNAENKCFQYAASVVLNYEEIKWRSERLSNFKPFINKYYWKRISYPSKIDDWETFQKNYPTIALNILYIKEKEICPVYISKINLNSEKQITLLIPNREKEGWHYLALKLLSALLRGITWWRTKKAIQEHI